MLNNVNRQPNTVAAAFVSSVQGVENYSRHLDGRGAGDPPETLVDYFPEGDWLLVVDESHVSAPQLGAMWGGDQARKRKLVEHGFRLPSALDNRPLKVYKMLLYLSSRSRQGFRSSGNLFLL